MTRLRAALLALGLLLASSGGTAFAVSNPSEMLPDRRQEQRAERIGHQLRCLVCQNESVEESEADLARDLRRIIRQRVNAGDTDEQVMAWMVARYGEFVRLRPAFEPTTLLLWGAPVLALLVGAAAVVLGSRRARTPPPALSDDERRRLADLLKS